MTDTATSLNHLINPPDAVTGGGNTTGNARGVHKSRRATTMQTHTESATSLAHSTKNDTRLDDFEAKIDELGTQAGQGKDVQIKYLLAVCDAAYQGIIDLTKDKHGDGVDDAQHYTQRYWKQQGNATIFDAKKPNQRKTASTMRTSIKLGSCTKFGAGEPIGTVSKLMTLRTTLKKKGIISLDDAANTFLKYARVQLKRDDLLVEDELESLCMKRDPEPRTVEDVLEAIRKQAKNLYDGKAKAGACNTPAVKQIVDAASRQLRLFAEAKKASQEAERDPSPSAQEAVA